MNLSPTELRLQSRVDRREIARGKADEIVATENPSDSEQQHLTLLREEMVELDTEIAQLLKDKEQDDEASKQSKLVRQALLRETGVDEDGAVYQNFAQFARDVIITRESSVCSKIAAQFGDEAGVQSAHARLELLKRTPANTLSSDVGGLIPPQHIAQIFQVIDASRPLVASATKAELSRGTLTYPKITTRPVVAVQATEKTEAGNTGMVIDMVTATASVYLGGGDLSWQAINWSTPSALDLWFQLAAADYALKTETDAATVLTDSAQSHSITTRFGATGTFAEFMTAIGAGAGAVYAASGRMANTVWMAPDRYWYIFGTTSQATAQFTTVSGDGVGPLRFLASRGLDAGTVIVGDSAALLCAETPGAPVELRVVEPAIGGLEVGIIGGFEAVAADDTGAFSLITTVS